MKLKVEQKMNKKSNNKNNTGYNWYKNTIHNINNSRVSSLK
jgi:hypothetical protein